MTTASRKRLRQIGRAPGELVLSGEGRAEKPRITIIDYDEGQFREKEVKNAEACRSFRDSATVTWINIDGIHNIEVLEKIGKLYALHPLILEDILDTEQRPKLEDFEDHLFVALKMFMFDDGQDKIKTEQVSLILGTNFVISFQEAPGDVFDPLRDRIRNAKGRVRKMGADYLAYAMLDAIVDGYFLILEKTGEKIEGIEEELISNPEPETMQKIHDLKSNTIFLRKSVWPLREVISGLQRGESSLIRQTTNIYLRDVYDHTIQVIDTIETYRDMTSGMLDIYLSSLSNRMNEVMKVLTIIATIFIPLTFIAGVYGMNFNLAASPWNMPELNWRYGYLCALGAMVAVVVVMLVYFRRKKWF